MTDWKSSLRYNPIPWLVETACAPIRYRVLTELLDLGRDDPDDTAGGGGLVDTRHFDARLGPPVDWDAAGRVNRKL